MFVGFVFIFIMIWIGILLMIKLKNDLWRVFGFFLIFLNMLFVRFFGVVIGGGDEVWGLNLVLYN